MNVFSGYMNVQSATGHALWLVQNAFPNHDLSSPWVPNQEWDAMLNERGLKNAILSGEMNAQLPKPYKSLATFEIALFRSTFPYSVSCSLVFMDVSSFNCDSGAVNIREMNHQRREVGRARGMAHERWLSAGLPAVTIAADVRVTDTSPGSANIIGKK